MVDDRSDEKSAIDAERRQADRRKWLVDVQFEGGDATGIAQTGDISLGGLYLTTDAEFEPGTTIFLRLTVGGRQVGFSGIVAYADRGRGIGVRFEELSEESQNLLKDELGLG